MTKTSNPQDNMTPLDGAISTVDSYIANPSQVTPDTLKALRDQLVAIQADVEGNDTGDDSQGQVQPNENQLSGSIYKKRMEM